MDNARSVGFAASERLLGELGAQVSALSLETEVIIVHDPLEAGPADMERVRASCALRAGPTLSIDVLAVPGARYYALKNAGTRAARGALVLHTDSDVVIEPGFVANMVASFDRSDVCVVTGNTYIGPCDTFFDRTVALCWLFPPRSNEVTLRPCVAVNANSLAARREVFLRFPFPIDQRFRGACQDFAAQVRAAGMQTWENPSVRCAHAKPAGWRGIARSALWRGHDRCCELRSKGATMAGPVRATRGLGTSLGRALGRIRRDANQVGATPAQVPAIAAAALGYELLIRTGYVVTRIAPNALPSVLQR